MDTHQIRNALTEAAVLDIMLGNIQDEVTSRRDLLATVPANEELFNRYQAVYTQLVKGRQEFTRLCETLVELVDLVEKGS